MEFCTICRKEQEKCVGKSPKPHERQHKKQRAHNKAKNNSPPGASSPTIPRFLSRASLLQSMRIRLKPIMRAFCVQNGGPAKHMSLLETHHASIVFANEGDWAPTNLPPAFLSRASLLQTM